VSSYRTEKRRIEGAGSAHHGGGEWIKERVSSLALVPLTIWGLWSATRLVGAEVGFGGALAWLHQPVNAVLTALLVLASLYHMQLGLKVVIEDYLHKPVGKSLFLLLNLFVCLALAAAAVFSILKVALGGGLGV
jgi:succinate dehydrogenase / fumarate reductase membrane anchor subunit